MKHQNCLNCDKKLIDNYCSSCGQKADTHRITFKKFIFHDVLHGIFHIDKGMLFTAKQALTRPGKAALDYISGKRIRFYNVFYLVLIVMGLILFFRHFLNEFDIDEQEVINSTKKLNQASKTMDEIITQKSKLIIFLFVPLAALNSFILFKRKKLNITEHSIISGMILLGMLLISLFGHLFFYIDLIIPFNSTFAYILGIFFPILIIMQVIYGYYNAFSDNYSKLGISYRITLFFALFCFEILVLFMLLFGIISDWKFGELSLKLF